MNLTPSIGISDARSAGSVGATNHRSAGGKARRQRWRQKLYRTEVRHCGDCGDNEVAHA